MVYQQTKRCLQRRQRLTARPFFYKSPIYPSCNPTIRKGTAQELRHPQGPVRPTQATGAQISPYDAMINPECKTENPTKLRTSRNRCNNPNHQKRMYVGQITNLEIINNIGGQTHQTGNSPQDSEATQLGLMDGETKTPWTPHQTYDSKGNGNFHQNSEGVVLTTPSGHLYCAHCQIPSHPRRTCPLRLNTWWNKLIDYITQAKG